MDTQDHAIYGVWRRKTIWSELELNPGSLTTQATALTTRQCLLGHLNSELTGRTYQLRQKRGESRQDVGDGQVQEEEVHPGQLLLPADDGHDAAAVALEKQV